MMENNQEWTREKLEKLPSEQLDELLHAELKKEDDCNENVIRWGLEILDEREYDWPVLVTKEAQAAWEKFLRDCEEDEKQLRRKERAGRWRWVAVAAVLVCVLTVAMPSVMGQTTVLDMLGSWTDSVVAFFSGTEQPAYEFKTDHLGLQQIYDTVAGYGITQPVVPMWVPDGYELVEIKTQNTPAKIKVYALLQSGENAVVFNMEIFGTETPRQYEVDNPNTKKVELAGIKHSITSNDGKWVAMWSRDNIECTLTVDGEEDTLLAILETIYTTEAD